MEHGVVIPDYARITGGAAPAAMSGDQAAVLIANLHDWAECNGYLRVRLDRGQRGGADDYYELGYSHGEVGVRLSHSESFVLRHNNDESVTRFQQALASNQQRAGAMAAETARRTKKGKK